MVIKRKRTKSSRTCSTNGSDKECVDKGRDHWGHLGVDRIIQGVRVRGIQKYMLMF
jgi:hypothetical protein